MSSELLEKAEAQSLGSLTEIRLGKGPRGSRVLTHVLKYSSGIKVSVTSSKSMWGRLNPMSGGLTEQYIWRLEPIIVKLLSTLTMGFSKEHGTKTTSTSACVELGLPGFQPAPISISMTTDDSEMPQSTELIQWLTNWEHRGPKTSPLSSLLARSRKSWTPLRDAIGPEEDTSSTE